MQCGVELRGDVWVQWVSDEEVVGVQPVKSFRRCLDSMALSIASRRGYELCLCRAALYTFESNSTVRSRTPGTGTPCFTPARLRSGPTPSRRA